MVIYITAIAIALVGLVLHWFKRWWRGQTGDNFIDHLFINKKHTGATLISLVGAASAVVSVGIDLSDAQTIGTLITTGYTLDSLVNKGSE